MFRVSTQIINHNDTSVKSCLQQSSQTNLRTPIKKTPINPTKKEKLNNISTKTSEFCQSRKVQKSASSYNVGEMLDEFALSPGEWMDAQRDVFGHWRYLLILDRSYERRSVSLTLHPWWHVFREYGDAENYFELSLGLKMKVRREIIMKYIKAGPQWWQRWMDGLPNEWKMEAREFGISVLLTRMGRIWGNTLSRVNGDTASRTLKREREDESDETFPSYKSQLVCPSCQGIRVKGIHKV